MGVQTFLRLLITSGYTGERQNFERIQPSDFQQIILLICSTKQLRKTTLRDIWNFSTANNFDEDTVMFFHILMELDKQLSLNEQITLEVMNSVSSVYDLPKTSKKTRIAPTMF